MIDWQTLYFWLDAFFRIRLTQFLAAVLKPGIIIRQRRKMCMFGDASQKPMIYLQQMRQKSLIATRELTGQYEIPTIFL